VRATVCNPLLRTPLALIVDDSCPVINLTYYWIRQRHAWKARHQPGVPPERWEGDPRKLKLVPPTIPADFARTWGEWCGEQGVRGKFSLIPFPAGQGRIDQGFADHDPRELVAWLDVARDVLAPSFDLTPEMLTHSHVADLNTWQLTDEWEQVEWVDPPVEPLTDYIATAMQLLRNVGIACEGVTSPGAFGKKNEPAYARAILDAAMRVNGVSRPFYFLWHKADAWPDVPLWYAEPEKGIAIASIVSCAGDWFGGWTGFDPGDPDRFITEDLRGGRLPPVLERGLPCVLIGHWPGFYYGGEEVGFDVLKEVKRRLDAWDPDGSRTRWMTLSAIGRYAMARELSQIDAAEGTVTVRTQFPTEAFTLRLGGCQARGIRVGREALRRVASARDLRDGTFLPDGRDTVLAFSLPIGESEIHILQE